LLHEGEQIAYKIHIMRSKILFVILDVILDVIFELYKFSSSDSFLSLKCHIIHSLPCLRIAHVSDFSRQGKMMLASTILAFTFRFEILIF